MDVKSSRVPVAEIMTREPVTAPPDLPLHRAASLMRDRGVGSVIVVDGSKPIGIVTERDIVTKVAAENRSPSSVTVREVMTSPVISVHPDVDVEEAARKMSGRRIRRLPVVTEGKLVGVVTENDILRLLPHLVEITRERARAGFPDPGVELVEGHCDSCGVFSKELVQDGKLLRCPDCRAR